MTVKIKVIGISILLLLLLFFLITLNKSSVNKAFVGLSVGSHYNDLLKVAGKPSYITDGTLWVEPEHKKTQDQIIENCIKEAWYETGFYFFPSKYSFCYDLNNTLLHKYHWSSW